MWMLKIPYKVLSRCMRPPLFGALAASSRDKLWSHLIPTLIMISEYTQTQEGNFWIWGQQSRPSPPDLKEVSFQEKRLWVGLTCRSYQTRVDLNCTVTDSTFFARKKSKGSFSRSSTSQNEDLPALPCSLISGLKCILLIVWHLKFTDLDPSRPINHTQWKLLRLPLGDSW